MQQKNLHEIKAGDVIVEGCDLFLVEGVADERADEKPVHTIMRNGVEINGFYVTTKTLVGRTKGKEFQEVWYTDEVYNVLDRDEHAEYGLSADDVKCWFQK